MRRCILQPSQYSLPRAWVLRILGCMVSVASLGIIFHFYYSITPRKLLNDRILFIGLAGLLV